MSEHRPHAAGQQPEVTPRGGLPAAAESLSIRSGVAGLRHARVVLLESYWAPLWPTIEYDPARMVERLGELGADTLRFGTIGYWAHFPTPHLRLHPELERSGRDLLAETVTHCHAAGIRVVAYLPVGHWLPPWQVEGHPDWLARDPEGRAIPHQFLGTLGLPELRHVCTSGSYRTAIREIVAAVASAYRVDALYFDGPFGDQYGRICHCDACREQFRVATGHDLPPWRSAADADPQRDLFWELLAWRNADGVAFLRELAQAVAGAGRLPILINRPSLAHSGLRNRFDPLILAVDGNLVEAGRDYRDKIAVSLLTASLDRPAWNYIGNYGPYPRIFEQRRDTLLEGFATIAAGGTPAIASGNRLYYDRAGDGDVRELFDFVARAAGAGGPLEGLLVAPFAALPYVQTTAERAPGGAGAYNAAYHALFHTLLDGQVQVCPVPESLLEDGAALRRYPVLLLPAATCLSDRQLATVRAYVAAGGGLLTTHEASLYDEYGRARGDFGLADLLGVHYAGTEAAIFDTYVRILEPWPVVLGSELPAGTLLPQPVRTRVRLAGAAGEATPLVVAESMVGAVVEGPGVVVRRFGQGRVCYLVSDLPCLYHRERERQHFFHHLPAVRRATAALVTWLSGATVPFSIRAAPTGGGPAPPVEGIVGVLMTKPGLHVLHVLDYRGPRYEAPHAVVESGAGPLDLLVQMRLPPDAQVRSVVELRSGRRLAAVRSAGSTGSVAAAASPSTTITVPAVDGYAAVAVSYSHA